VKLELTEALWLDQYGSITLLELAEHSGLPVTEVGELVELGVFEPLERRPGEDPLFGAESLVTARVACRLREDFELDPHGVAVVLELLERVHELEAEVQALRASLPRVSRG
jgi:chaperone modulatory protein CbpM